MKAAILFLCLVLARENSASVVRIFWPQRDASAVQELTKIHWYEEEFQKMLQDQKTSSSQETSESTSDASNEIKFEIYRTGKKPYAAPELSPKMRNSDLIILQEILSSDPNTSQETKDPEHIFEDAYTVMKHVKEEDKVQIRQAFAAEKEVKEKNAIQLIEDSNYGVEEYEVKTEDGYYLTLFRVQPKQKSQEVQKRPVVLLMHGLFGSADDWLLMGPKKSLAYEMLDAGFDVWLGNVRGSKYSRRHANKHAEQSDFWQFSIDEIAARDLPAIIDFTLQTTEVKKLYYVGHSLGTTAFFAMASTQPEYKQKVAMMYALSPMVYMTHVRSPLINLVAPKSRFQKLVNEQLGEGEFKPSHNFIRSIGGKMCEDVISNRQVCSNLKFVVFGIDSAGMDRKILPMISKHSSADTSVRQIKQYGQAKSADQLRKYDFGVEMNKMVYGQPEPPKYNMTDVQVPVALYYSEEDLLAHPKDVERLRNELPDVRDYFKVPEQHFSHMDFQFSTSSPVTINQRLINSIKQDYVTVYE